MAITFLYRIYLIGKKKNSFIKYLIGRLNIKVNYELNTFFDGRQKIYFEKNLLTKYTLCTVPSVIFIIYMQVRGKT